MSLHDAAIGILKETGLVLEQSESLSKDWVEKSMTNEEIARFFNSARPHIQGNPKLRDFQVEGWFRTPQHFRNNTDQSVESAYLSEFCAHLYVLLYRITWRITYAQNDSFSIGKR